MEKDSAMVEFSYLSKNEFNKYASELFSVLYDNMTQIAPTGNSREEDYKSWYKAMCGEMQRDNRHIIVISNENMKEIIIGMVSGIVAALGMGGGTILVLLLSLASLH